MKKIKILIPVYNDWQSVFKLLESIDSEITDLNINASVLIVNDASTEKRPEINTNLNNIKSVQVINMKENRGHAKCIATGLKYIFEEEEFDYVIPMDGDGEDRPEELKSLIEKTKEYPDTVITADRIKRSEGLLFKFCYLAHKYLTFIFAGQSIKFGNYTCLPKSTVARMIEEASTWSSFSGSLAKITKERRSVPSIRGSRYFGPSKMSFIDLLKHSLSIIAVFKFTVIIRSIIFLVAYVYLVLQHISFVTLIPIFLIIIMNIFILILSRLENISELNNSLTNISDTVRIK